MKTSVLKKSLLDYAIKGHLSAKWRRLHPNANAFDEINVYNAQILKDKKAKQGELTKLENKLKKEKDKERKQDLKTTIQNLKKEIAKLKTIAPLNSPCHFEPKAKESQHNTITLTQNQNLFSQKEKGFIPSPLPLAPKRTKSPLFLIQGESLANPLLAKNRAGGTTAPAFSDFSHHEVGENPTLPFEIPPTWVWVRLGDIGEVFTGITPKTSKMDNFGTFIPFLGPGDIDELGNVCYDNKGLSQMGLKEARKIQPNSILVTCIGGLIGKSCIVDRECTCNQQINIISPCGCINFKMLYYFINSQYFQILMQENSTGTATPIINKTLFENLLIPLPPLAEQKELVRILDSLITLANEFDKTKEELKRIEKRIEKSLLKYATEGNLSKLFRTLHPSLNAFDEINAYNTQI
ncbi:restriction endonuclease subunit S, partial [Campylobacter sp. MIT 21-1685]|uniref:restriction endonuclease subunit S n=1 Tax=unclassified Campylobacter TaxID=2593542 RepID=UPI00224B8661